MEEGFGSRGEVLSYLVDRMQPRIGIGSKLTGAILRKTDYETSATTLHKITTGKVPKPSGDLLNALAEFFDVETSSFYEPYVIRPRRDPKLRRVADRLNKLIDTTHAPDEPPLDDEQIARALTERGCPTGAYYIRALRAGDADAEEALTVRQMRALAEIFGISTSPGFFIDDTTAARVLAQLDKLDTLAAETTHQDTGP